MMALGVTLYKSIISSSINSSNTSTSNTNISSTITTTTTNDNPTHKSLHHLFKLRADQSFLTYDNCSW